MYLMAFCEEKSAVMRCGSGTGYCSAMNHRSSVNLPRTRGVVSIGRVFEVEQKLAPVGGVSFFWRMLVGMGIGNG